MVGRIYTKQSLSRVHHLTHAPSRGIMDQYAIWKVRRHMRLYYD